MLSGMGLALRNIDFSPFVQASSLVFDGPWIADRYAGIGGFVDSHPDAVLPTTRAIIGKGRDWSAVDAFTAMEQLLHIKAYARVALAHGNTLVVPTVAPLYSVAAMLEEPVVRNNHHGYYSYFVNPLDLCAISIPAGFYANGMPFGITLIAPAFSDRRLAGLADHISTASAIVPGKPRS
jgi:Asp-tRNA(Asn)/Glu-tRNA(Gln) amidotransferase A subunit family amidase